MKQLMMILGWMAGMADREIFEAIQTGKRVTIIEKGRKQYRLN
jgi:hypothetical protein